MIEQCQVTHLDLIHQKFVLFLFDFKSPKSYIVYSFFVVDTLSKCIKIMILCPIQCIAPHTNRHTLVV